VRSPGEGNTHRAHENSVTLAYVEVEAGKEMSTGTLPGQNYDFMMEDVERKALSQVSFEVRLEEVVPPSEEIPSMVKLYTPQLGELVLLIFGTESVVGSSCHKDNGGCGCGGKLIVLTGRET
jgi:hypothetical protein